MAAEEVGVEVRHTPTGDLPPPDRWCLVVQGWRLQALPPLTHPGPHPRESAPLLKAQQNPQVTSWLPHTKA